MKYLENKIRRALPRLKELTKGCKIYDKESMFPYEIVDNRYCPQLYCYEYSSFRVLEFQDLKNFETVGHPIKLNDVLEYLNSKSNIGFGIYSNGTFIRWTAKAEEYYEIRNYKGESFKWDLSSVFLADQSDELKEFLNNL